MADGKVVIETDLDSSGIEKGLTNLEKVATKGLKVAAAAITGTATALAGVATAAAKTGADFESQMSRVKAISGATGEEFEKLKAQAIELGAETSFSASQAAEGMENLAAAGFTTTETMEAMPGLLDLAAASGEDLASSSDIATSALRGFGMEASEAGHVADVLAENANRTNSSVAETGEAMKYVAPLARSAGLSFEETAAAIGIMANAGIQGSQAGTTLRGAISRLSKPTDDMQNAMDDLGISFYDADGKMKSLSDQVVAFKGYKVLTSANKAAKTLAATAKMLSAAEKANALQVLAASGALTAKEMIVGVCTGKIKLATAAQAAWNAVMKANPIGLLVTAIGALVAGIGAYALTQKRAASATGELTENQKENIEASKEAIKNIEEEAAARQKTINASTVEIDQAESLWNELTKITDENGRVKDGYEARANYIAGELSSALGMEIALTDGVIGNYQQLTGSIHDLIAAKKAQAVMDSMESEYAQAIQEQAENVAKLAQSYNDVNRLQDEKLALEAEAAELAKSTNYADASRYAEIKDELQGVNNKLKEQKAAFDVNQAAVKDNQKVIADYNKLTEAVMSGSTEEINSALAEIQSGLDTTLDSGSKAALEQAQTTGDSLLSILTAQEQGLAEVQQSTIDSTADAMGVALNTIGSSSENMKSLLESVGADGAQKLLTAMKNADLEGNLSEEAKSGMQAMIAAIESEDGTLKSTGKDSASKYAEGMESQSDRAKTAGRTINDSADSGARSKTGYDAGYGFGSGFVSGIQAWVGQGVVAAANLAAQALESAKTTIDSHSPSKETMKLGKYFGQGFELGIAGEKKRVGNASKELANVALQSLDMSSVTDRMRETMALNAARVTRSFGIETNSMILNKHQAEMMLHLSDTEINRLAKAVGKYTAAVVQKQKPAPIYLGTERIDKSLPKGAIPRI